MSHKKTYGAVRRFTALLVTIHGPPIGQERKAFSEQPGVNLDSPGVNTKVHPLLRKRMFLAHHLDFERQMMYFVLSSADSFAHLGNDQTFSMSNIGEPR